MNQREIAIALPDGAIPCALQGPEDARDIPALVVIPSIYGSAPDLMRRLGELGDGALVVAPDPFWRRDPGVVPYDDRERAIARLRDFDPVRCRADLQAVYAWSRAHANGRVVGLGICFGGPFVMLGAAAGLLDGVVTWHGSRMEQFLERADAIRCPLRLHFGDADPVTPQTAIEAIRTAFADHPDLAIAVHLGAQHGFSHDGPAYHPAAARAGLDATRALLASFTWWTSATAPG